MSINHGTRSGYYAHRRLSDPPCDLCRAAISAYVRGYRKKNNPVRNTTREKVRRKALSALRDLHRQEYEDLVDMIQTEVDEANGVL